MKLLAATLLLFCVIARGAETPSPRITALQSPAATSAIAPTFARDVDHGDVWCIWFEPSSSGQHSVRCSAFDRDTQRWRAPQTISAAQHLVLDSNASPALTAGPGGQLTAAWTVTARGLRQVVFSRSADAGVTWSSPTPLSRDATDTAHPALAALPDGRVLAAWLTRSGNSSRTALVARVIELRPSAAATETLIATSVSESSPPALTAFFDGSALLSYRGRSAENIRDLYHARFSPAGWTESSVLNADLWRTDDAIPSGPRLASDGGRVSAAWFAAADNNPRVLFSTSSDAGARFLLPVKINSGHAIGSFDTVLLHDGAALVTWLETAPSTRTGGLWLRRVSPQSSLDEPVLISAADADPIAGPRAVLLRDFSGDSLDAQLLIAYTSANRLHTLLITIPEAHLLTAANEACGCGDAPAQLIGFPFRGTLVAPLPNEEVLLVNHPDLPGLLAAGTHRFRAAPSVVATMTRGQEFIGQVERRAGDWWLSNVRVLVAAPMPSLAPP